MKERITEVAQMAREQAYRDLEDFLLNNGNNPEQVGEIVKVFKQLHACYREGRIENFDRVEQLVAQLEDKGLNYDCYEHWIDRIIGEPQQYAYAIIFSESK